MAQDKQGYPVKTSMNHQNPHAKADPTKLNFLNDDRELERDLERRLPELVTLQRLARTLDQRARVRVEATVEHKGKRLPLVSIVLGSEDPTAPALGVFGGVHGLERIGSDVVIAWLQSLTEMMTWDDSVQTRLKKSRLIFMPVVNPVGVYERSRSNGNGVDLMRNSPVKAEEKPWFLLGGHQYSNKLPWYSPTVTQENDMELEARTLCEVVRREMFQSRCALTVDVHSGFGSVDRFWFPWAKSKQPPPHIEEIAALKRVFDRSYPNNFYQIEPQAKSYTTHGDLWDWLYELKLQQPSDLGASPSIYIPFTLELGSWLWLKKNPRQMFTSLGGFHPIQPHRLKRILRRHLSLFDFLHRAIISSDPWTALDIEARKQLRTRAMDVWYGE